MKMVITAYPARQIPISVVRDIDSNFLLDATAVWYKDLYTTASQLKLKFPEIDEIVLFGPLTYIEHIAQELAVVFSEDDELQITIMTHEDSNKE